MVEINEQVLYRSDIEKITPANSTPEDSISYAENYIKKWVTRNLMYEKASKNIDDMDEINQLVEDYRKSLVIHHYQQKLVEQRVKEPSEEEIKRYYDNNSEKFKLKKNLVKGLYIKLPKKAPKIEKLKSWIGNQTPEHLQEIEKYSYQNAVNYEYFGENWVIFDDLMKKIPFDEKNVNTLLHKKLSTIEDDKFIYILAINEFKEVGSTEPLDFAGSKIKVILMNINKNKYINEFEEELYDKALKKGEVKLIKE